MARRSAELQGLPRPWWLWSGELTSWWPALGTTWSGMISGHQVEAGVSVVKSVDLAVSCHVSVVALGESLTSPSYGFLVCKMGMT